MKKSRCIFALLFLALSIHLTNQVNVQQFNTEAPKYYPFGEYDVIDSAEFRAAAYGTFQYSIATWFKIAPTTVRTITTTEYDALLHLTALDTDFPWDATTCPSSMTQLADLVLVRLYGGDSELYVNLASFTSSAISDQTGYGLVTDCWHFLYVGVDHINGAASFGVFSDGCQGYYRWNAAMTFSGTYTNEALDNRATLYLGGAKNHLSTLVSGYNSWPGQLYRTMFLSGFMTLFQPTARMLMNGETSNMYIFYLDDVSISSGTLESYGDPNSIATVGTSPADPTPTVKFSHPSLINRFYKGVSGLQFASADSDSMTFTLSKDFGNYHFISLWVKVDASAASSANHLIMSVVTPEGNEFISLIFVKASTSLTLRRGSATVPSPQTITLGTWHFVFISFGYHTIDTSASIVVQFVLDTTQVLTNQVLVASVPEDYVQPLRVVHFGSLGGSDSVFDGEIRNVIGGTGSYFTLDTTSTSCIFAVGLGSPYCLYCPTSMYYDTTGTCLTACPSDSYLDSITNACIPCHETCATCTGPGAAACTSCSIDTPVAFDSRCFTTCPVNTIKAYDGTCECDESCSGCDYSDTTKTAQCVGCALPTYSLLADASRCVDVGQCPSGYVSDLSSQTCVISCSGVIDYANGKCSTYCPTNTAKVAGPPVACYAYCPAGTYEDVITASVAGETTRGCTACTGNCATCLDSTSCLTCTPPYLYHEDVNECHLTCQSGFQYESENNFCQACRTGCTACSSLLYLYATDSTCVEECPIGTQPSSGQCVAVTGVDAQILNNSGLVPPLTVSTRENLVLLGDYVAPSTISTILWSISDATKSAQFFSGVNKASKDLVVPSENLLDGTSYTVIYTVTDSLGNVGTDSIDIQTESAITSGTFTVTPSTGIAFDTEFTFAISGFSSSTTIKYDITTFFERTQTINGVDYTERVKTMTIVKGVNAGTYTFVYPVCEDTIPFTVELCAYNDDQEACTTKKITVNNSGELPLQKVIVWTSAASTITDIGAMLDFVRSAAYFYTRDWSNLISTNYYRGLLLIKNLVIDKDLVACSTVAECSNSGSCAVSGSSFTCSCESDQGGYNCFYGERDYDTVTGQIADILKNLYSVTLTSSNVETAILILDQVSMMKDMLSKNGIFYFRDIVGKILKVEGLELHHYRYLFSILGETIEFAKRPLTSTWFKTTDQSLLLNNLTSLVETTFNQINTIWSTGSYFIADTNFIEVFIISGVPSTLLGSESYYSIDFESFGYKIPSSVLSSLNRVSIKLLGYKVNPYGQSQTNSQITSVSKLEIYDVEGQVSVTGAADNIVILIPKLTATPVFVPVSGTKAWNCEFKTTTDGATISFDTTGCSLISENITHISCGCTHLTEFTGQLVVDNVALTPSSSGILDATTDLIASQIMYETAKRAYIVETPSTPTVIVAGSPDIIRDFYWSTNAFYIGVIVFAFYIFAILLNMGNRRKNSLKTSLEEGRSILVLTYHPILSLFIHAHTAESNTQLMRISKFFCQLESYIGLSGVFYFLLDLQLSLSGGSKLIAAAVMTLLIAPLASYIPEFAYRRHKKKKNEDQRMTRAYHKIQLFLILVWFLVGVASVGFIRAGFRGSWLGSLILTAALDLFVLDFVILIFAIVKRNNTKLLRCFQRKGYYVDVGSSAILKNDDEIILMAKIKRVLKQQKKKKTATGNYPNNDTSRALTFGDKSQMEDNQNYKVEEIEDMNASVETDANHVFSPEIEMKNMNEDEVPINSSKRSHRTVTATGNNHQEQAHIHVEEDQQQPQGTAAAAADETREKIMGGGEVRVGRRGTRQRTGKASNNEDEQLFEINDNLDLDELVNQIDKIARPKPRVVTNSPANNPNATIKASVPVYHLARRAQNRNKNKH